MSTDITKELAEALTTLLPILADWHEEFPQDVGDKEAPAIQVAKAALASYRSQAEGDGWISVKDRMPAHRQNVLFVVRGEGRQDYLDGVVLGGFFDETCSSFNTPGVGYWASHWRPAPAAPSLPSPNGEKQG